MTLLTILGAMLGAAFASFSGVIVVRVPRGRSIVSQRSACAICSTPLPWYDNIPIVSWLMLRGSCRTCHTKLPISLLAFEIAGALIGAGVVYAFIYPII